MPDWRRCAIRGCHFATHGIHDGVRLYGLPKEPQQNRKWCKWIAAQNKTNSNITSRSYLCSQHFTENVKGSKKLKAGAVPSIPNVIGLNNVYEEMVVSTDDDTNMEVDENENVVLLTETCNDFDNLDVEEVCVTSEPQADVFSIDDMNVPSIPNVVLTDDDRNMDVGENVLLPTETCNDFDNLDVQEICVTSNPQPVLPKRISRKCSVVGCASNNITHSLFAFPKVPKLTSEGIEIDQDLVKRCEQWIKFSGNRNILLKDMSCLHRYFYVCDRHFSKNDYYLTTRMNLKRGVVPTLFGPEPLSDTSVEILSQGYKVLNGAPDENNGCPEGYALASRGCTGMPSSKYDNLAKKFDNIMKSFEMKSCDLCNEKYLWYAGMKRVHRKKSHCWKFSCENKMDPGEVPDALKNLSFVEEQLISRVHPVLSVYKLKGLQYGYKGNVINFFQDVSEFAKQLPHRLEDISSILTVKINNTNSNITEFRVRMHKVRSALLWLKSNNPYYEQIEILEDNLQLLPEDGNVFDLKSFCLNNESEEVYDKDDAEENAEENAEDNAEDNYIHVDSSAVPESTFYNQDQQVNCVLNWPQQHAEPVKESTPGFIVCAFPTLFPYGNCDLKDERQKEVKLHEYMKHLLCYKDDRFANHKTFRFFAFNMWMRHTALSSGNVFVKKDSAMSNMNVDGLRKHVLENPSAIKKLMYMGSNLRGSKSFWKSRSGELRDMVEQLGLPSIFLTMSAADTYWPDLFRILTGKDISQISKSERRRLLQDNPMIVDMFFLYRVECFVENVLEPAFGVVDYWYRIEYQHRGSPHVHGLFWLQDAPDITKFEGATEEEKQSIINYFDKLVSAVIPNKDCAVPDQHPCEIRFEDISDKENDLSQLVKMVQMHKCSKSYCKRTDKKTKRTYCRFHFPKEIRNESDLIMNVEKKDLEFFPERNDENLNKFNPFIISSWRANVDIAPVVSKRAVIEYLCKYVTKSEISSQTLKDICKDVCDNLDGSDKAKKAVQKILIKNCVERDISAQEVCHILMGLKLYSSGKRKFVIVHTAEKMWMPLEQSNEEDDTNGNLNGKSVVDKYMSRPSHLENISLFNVAKFYNVNNWSKAKKFNIVRVFPRLVLSDNDDKNEEFYRQQVLLHVPFRKIENLAIDQETWKATYERHQVPELQNNILDSANIQVEVPDEDIENVENVSVMDHTEDWMIASRIRQYRNLDPVSLGKREVDAKFDWHYNDTKYDVYGGIPALKRFINDEKKKDDDAFIRQDMPDVVFSKEQTCVKELMEKQLHALDTGDLEGIPKRILVQGKAGTGKSLLIKFLVEKLCQQYGPSSFLLLGPTGVSAINVGGTTIHSALHFPKNKSEYKELRGDVARNFCNKMEEVKFVICDEFSMIGTTTLALIDKRLREGKGINEPFGNLFMYMFGDYKQLPPVRDDSLFGGPIRNDLSQHGRNMFQLFEKHFILKEVFRQKDKTFLDMLDRLSCGQITQQDYQVLKMRFIHNVNCETEKKFENAIRLMSTKKAVKDFNTFKQLHLVDAEGNFVPIATIPCKEHGEDAHMGTMDDAGGLERELYLGIGTRVMLRGTNIWTRKGLVNGALGTVQDILYEDGAVPPLDPPSVIMIKFDHYSGPGIGPDNLVPITTLVRSWTKLGKCSSRQQFPISVAYACTIHKSQGLTLDQAVVDIGDSEFALGITYVGLSRVKALEGLLLQPFTKERLTTISRHKGLSVRKDFENLLNLHNI